MKRCRATAVRRILLTTILLLTPGVLAGQRPGGSADSTRVRIDFSGVYDNSEASKRFIDLIASVLPARRERIAADSSVEAVIFERYNISEGPRAQLAGLMQPRLVEELRNQIAELNPAVGDKGMLKAGEYVLPTIPPQAVWNANLKALRSYAPQVIAASASLSRQVLDQQDWERAVNVVTAPEAEFSPNRVLDLTMAASEVKEFLARLGATGAPVDVSIGSTFAYRQAIPKDQDPAAPSYFPDSAGLAELGRALAAPRRRHVPLVILETNWPNDAVARTSCSAMAEILREVRRQWGIADAGRPECRDVAFAAPPDPEVHSATVLQSILPLETIDSTLVDVIFIPLGRYQGATPLLEELLRVNEIIAQKLAVLRNLAGKTPAALAACGYSENNPLTFPACGAAFTLPEENVSHAAVRASRVVAGLPESIANPRQRDGYQSATDLLTATVRVLSWHATKRKSGAVVNVSWTTDLLGGSIENSLLNNVLVVAAAGNDRLTVTAQQTQVDLGRRANDKFVLVALNLDSNGALTCKSSVVDTLPVEALEDQHVVGYDGSVGSRCGTSYAAPRIAWFAAAREAVRGGTVNTVSWASAAQRAFRRNPPPKSLRDLKYDPLTAFGAIAPSRAVPPAPAASHPTADHFPERP